MLKQMQEVKTSCILLSSISKSDSYSLPIIFHVTALKVAPMKGPTMNTHNWLSALPPSNTAGAMLRAGLTDVPV